MQIFPNLLFYFTLIQMISANILTLKDLRSIQDVQHDCNFNGKLIRAVVGLSNPSTRVASGYNGDLCESEKNEIFITYPNIFQISNIYTIQIHKPMTSQTLQVELLLMLWRPWPKPAILHCKYI